MKPREFMTFGALFYLVLSDVYGLFRQRVILPLLRRTMEQETESVSKRAQNRLLH